jgi:hypothetical protein
MSDTQSGDNVLDGVVDRPELARQLRCSARTIIRYEDAGLPVLRIGKRRFYDVDKVRAWVLNGGIRPASRRPGRRAAA